MNALFFWLFSGGMIVCALAVVLNRNAVASALCFTFAIVFMAGLFVMLSAFFLAAVQILVTAGAVMVLFLFIIMLLDLSAMEHIPRPKMWMGCSLVLALGFLLIVAKTLAGTPQGFVAQSSLRTPGQIHAARNEMETGDAITQSEVDQRDDTHRIGYLLFRTNTSNGRTSYVAPFEITSLLILVATIGVIVLCKQDERPRPKPREEITREAPPVEPKETSLKT
ncbi:MAG TPA: NADH-quinone oxidoreductase subunit J [Candidatus Methylacidiphilales bacterium]|jgi:NADH-quinone oxidoreductase subunit J|nr:NADH-quinone oxidoreductase subunit J [Candidatus Methylacidiphilales bacterium]